MSLAQLREIPYKSLILLVGPPGSGKSTFCHQTVLSNIELKPVIYVITESAPSKTADSLKQKGLGTASPNPLNFVDAFHETVGLPVAERAGTVNASSGDLTSIDIAISKLRDAMDERFLLIFDSLTSPYLMNGLEIVNFIRMTLSKLAAEGNAVLACIDEGCGKEEDLVAMMSATDGIIKIELMDGAKTFNVLKHPKVEPTKIEVPMTWSPAVSYHINVELLVHHVAMTMGLVEGPSLRTEVGDYVNLFWPNLARWSAMPQDPKRFPTLIYDYSKHFESMTRKQFNQFLPWRTRFFLKFMPKNFSKVKDIQKLVSQMGNVLEGDRSNIMEYLKDASKTDEHYMRGHECASCWGFENIGAALGLGGLGGFAGILMGFEDEDRDWNVIETKCIGLGDPYCEIMVAPREIDGLKKELEALDSTIINRIHKRLIDRLAAFMLEDKPLWTKPRPRLGNMIGLHAVSHIMVLPAIASERYRTAMRLGGTIKGKEIGELLMDANLKEEQIIKHIIKFLEHCKVGKVTIGEKIRIRENCESFMIKAEEPACHFTTGFLNGFLSAVKNQHIKETKCIAVGDPYCEWEFR